MLLGDGAELLQRLGGPVVAARDDAEQKARLCDTSCAGVALDDAAQRPAGLLERALLEEVAPQAQLRAFGQRVGGVVSLQALQAPRRRRALIERQQRARLVKERFGGVRVVGEGRAEVGEGFLGRPVEAVVVEGERVGEGVVGGSVGRGLRLGEGGGSQQHGGQRDREAAVKGVHARKERGKRGRASFQKSIEPDKKNSNARDHGFRCRFVHLPMLAFRPRSSQKDYTAGVHSSNPLRRIRFSGGVDRLPVTFLER
ncbi:MAG: hypothetical protein BRD52_02055 [Bacteroidetes bacterium SW_4_67_19]|nr:MAG: hypothetical protein BRD52_02055 [Bacteroidetes bacterium SW_4_67_19]